MSQLQKISDPLFFFGHTQTGQDAKARDWSQSSLGPAEAWPLELKVILGMMYENRHPVSLFWGEERNYFYNEAYLPIVGAAKHPWAMGLPGDVVWKEIWEFLTPQIDQVMAGGEATWNVDQYLPILGDDGKPRDAYFTYSYSPVFLLNGKIGGTLVTCTENTERVLAQKAKELSEERLNLALITGNIGFWDWNAKTGYTFLSDTLMEDWGIDPKTFNNTLDECMSLIHPDDRERIWKEIENATFNQRPYDVEYRVRRSQNEWIWVNAKGRYFLDKSGTPERLSGITINITRNKADEEKLQKAIRSRDEFMSLASHELKTPLTSLRIQSQLFDRYLKKDSSPEMFRQQAIRLNQLTDSQVTRLIRLIDDMLDVSRISTGKLQLQKSDFDLCKLIESIIHDMESLFLEKGYALPKLITCEETYGHWDRLRIEQAIMNIFTNAVRYGKQRPVEVRLKSDSEKISLSIKDEGIGIPKDYQDKIFKRFERSNENNDISGLGLGLYLTRQIVRAHGGKIWVESQPEKGSTFHIELPKQVQSGAQEISFDVDD